jgi:hypothetical protein
MACGSDSSAELACFSNAIAPDERPAHIALVEQLFGELVRERADLPNGYAYRFLPDAFELVARFIANERKCCPFLTFELEVSSDSGPIWLRLTGPAGTQGVLEAELEAPGPERVA